MADLGYAQEVAAEFVAGLADAGTTTALVFGAHFAPAVDALFAAASARGLRITSGLVVSDRMLRPELHTTAQRAYDDGLALASRWHGQGRNRYAVTPRFALSCTDDMLASCAALQAAVPGSWCTSHVNENTAEIAAVQELFQSSYVDSYDRHGLIGSQTVLAHNVHPTEAELERLSTGGAAVAHCPTSNAALGSGLFPLDRHLAHRVPVALGSDVGAGTGTRCSRRGCRRTSCSNCAAPTAYRSPRPICSTWPRRPERQRSASTARSAISASASGSTGSGYDRRPAARWTSACATQTVRRRRWRGRSRWASAPMWPVSGSMACR